MRVSLMERHVAISARGARRRSRAKSLAGVIGRARQRRLADTIRKPLARAIASRPSNSSGVQKRSSAACLRRRLQILADGEEIDIGGAQIVHHLHDLFAAFRPGRPSGRTW